MSNIDKRALREAAEKATKGEWWSDVVETDGEYGEGEDRVSGYHSYAVYVGHESLLDMTNSTAACIHTEWDHDYHMAWDETAKRNAEFIAAANPATVLALLNELEAADALNKHLELAIRKAEGCGEALRRRAEAAEKRIAELELRLSQQQSIATNNLDMFRRADARVTELEARELVVNLPAYVDGRTLGYGEVNHMIDLCADAIEKAGHAAGIITKVGGGE